MNNKTLKRAIRKTMFLSNFRAIVRDRIKRFLFSPSSWELANKIRYRKGQKIRLIIFGRTYVVFKNRTEFPNSPFFRSTKKVGLFPQCTPENRLSRRGEWRNDQWEYHTQIYGIFGWIKHHWDHFYYGLGTVCIFFRLDLLRDWYLEMDSEKRISRFTLLVSIIIAIILFCTLLVRLHGIPIPS